MGSTSTVPRDGAGAHLYLKLQQRHERHLEVILCYYSTATSSACVATKELKSKILLRASVWLHFN